ncbi:MAG: hypothetical protein AB7E68_03840 [Candidatus Babeliales bacterium]
MKNITKFGLLAIGLLLTGMNSFGAAQQKLSLNEQLIEAIFKKNDQEFLKLLNQGANVNAKDSLGNPALLAAMHVGTLYMVQELLNRNADPSIKGATKRNAVEYAFLDRSKATQKDPKLAEKYTAIKKLLLDKLGEKRFLELGAKQEYIAAIQKNTGSTSTSDTINFSIQNNTGKKITLTFKKSERKEDIDTRWWQDTFKKVYNIESGKKFPTDAQKPFKHKLWFSKDDATTRYYYEIYRTNGETITLILEFSLDSKKKTLAITGNKNYSSLHKPFASREVDQTLSYANLKTPWLNIVINQDGSESFTLSNSK